MAPHFGGISLNSKSKLHLVPMKVTLGTPSTANRGEAWGLCPPGDNNGSSPMIHCGAILRTFGFFYEENQSTKISCSH